MKVGLALGGGSARGLAHIGVLEVLEKEKIPFDMIAGTSAGALIGALYACGSNAVEIKKTITSMSLIDRARMIDLALPKTGLIAGVILAKWPSIHSLAERSLGPHMFAGLIICLSAIITIWCMDRLSFRKFSTVSEVKISSQSNSFCFTKWRK